MWLMLQQPKPEDFIIATGDTRTVREFAQVAFDYAGLDWKKHVVVDPSLYRPAEVHVLCGDYSKARKKLKWRPEVSFEQLVRMMVDSDLAALSQTNQNRAVQ